MDYVCAIGSFLNVVSDRCVVTRFLGVLFVLGRWGNLLTTFSVRTFLSVV